MKFRLIETFLVERSDYDKQAVAMLVNSGKFDEQQAVELVNKMVSVYQLHNDKLQKYLKGLIRIALEECKTKEDIEEFLLKDEAHTLKEFISKVLVIEKEKAETQKEKDAIDAQFQNNIKLQQIQRTVMPIVSQSAFDDFSDDEFSDRKSNDEYQIIPINSFEEFNKKFGGDVTGTGNGGAWCHANGKGNWDWFCNGGQNKCFVLAKKGWENIEFNPATSCDLKGKDEYGNSLIAIWANAGGIVNNTLRGNHENVFGDADNQYTLLELNNLAGFNVWNEIKKYIKDAVDNPLAYQEFIIKNGCLFFNKDAKYIGRGLQEECDLSGVKKVYIHGGIEQIGEQVFWGAKSIKQIYIEDGLYEIGDNAFEQCVNLVSINIPQSVESIGDEILEGCPNVIVDCTKNAYAEQYCEEHCVQTTQTPVQKISKQEVKLATLLTKQQAESVPEKFRKASDYWWLRSRRPHSSNTAAFVLYDGYVDDLGDYVRIDGGVRPALYLKNPESLNLEIGDICEINRVYFLYVLPGVLLSKDIVGKCAFRAEDNCKKMSDCKNDDWYKEDKPYNKYEGSDIEEYVKKWFEKL